MSIAEKLTIIAENQERVFEAGKKSQYDEFWDSFQANGNRTLYRNAFAGTGWGPETLKPKYLVKPSGDSTTYNMFLFCNASADSLNSKPIDFSLIADKFDFSQCQTASYTFQNCYIDNIYADFSNCSSLSNTFNHSYRGTTRNVTIKVSKKTRFDNTFAYGEATTVSFTEDSVIGQNGLSLTRQTNLTHENLMSIINALYDYSEDTSGTVWKVTLGSTNLKKLTPDEIAMAEAKGWYLE